LVVRKWCTLGELRALTREQVIDANELLDALDEAEEDRRQEDAEQHGRHPTKTGQRRR